MLLSFVRKRIKGASTGFELMFGLVRSGQEWRDLSRFDQLVVKCFEVVPEDRGDLHPRYSHLQVEQFFPDGTQRAVSNGQQFIFPNVAIHVDDGEVTRVLVQDLHWADAFSKSSAIHLVERPPNEHHTSMPSPALDLRRNAQAKFRNTTILHVVGDSVRPADMHPWERSAEVVYNPRAVVAIHACLADECQQMPVVCSRGTINCLGRRAQVTGAGRKGKGMGADDGHQADCRARPRQDAGERLTLARHLLSRSLSPFRSF